MGNKSAKKTNQMLEKQTNLANTAGTEFGDRSRQDYQGKDSLRNKIIGEYWNLYSGEGGDGEGGGGVDPTANVRMNEAMGTAREFMNTGGYTPEQKAEYLAYTGAVVPSFYQGLKGSMARANAATGGYSGYNTQSRALARDSARQGFLSNLEAKSGLESDIRNRRFQGMGAVGGFDTEYMNRLDRARAEAAANARAGAGRQDDYLRALTGLMGSYDDIPYANLQLGGYNQGMAGVNSRVSETPAWQQMAMGLIPSAANAALGIWGGGSKKPEYNANALGAANQYIYGPK